MRIYLDSTVFRELKKPEHRSLYELILADKKWNYYFFSEAHMHDLFLDKSGEVESDLEIMESIVGHNCWTYRGRAEFLSETPKKRLDHVRNSKFNFPVPPDHLSEDWKNIFAPENIGTEKQEDILRDLSHSYYAGHGQIFVTDNSGKFSRASYLFQIWDLDTKIYSLESFREYLMLNSGKDLSPEAMFDLFTMKTDLPVQTKIFSLDGALIDMILPGWYLGEFNQLCCTVIDGKLCYSFKKFCSSIDSSLSMAEMARVTDAMVAHFGQDLQGRTVFGGNEFIESEWVGREWIRDRMGILLQIDEGIDITFFNAEMVLNKNKNLHRTVPGRAEGETLHGHPVKNKFT